MRFALPLTLIFCSITHLMAGTPLDDKFDTNILYPTRWTLEDPSPVGGQGTVSVTNQRLEMTIGSSSGSAGIVSKCSVAGDFDVQVDYSLLNWPTANTYSVILRCVDCGVGTFGGVDISRHSSPYFGEAYVAVFLTSFTPLQTDDRSGKLRLVRTGSTLAGYYFNGSGWVLVGAGTVNTGATRLSLELGTGVQTAPGGIKAAFDNFQVNSGTVSCAEELRIMCRPVDKGSGLFGGYEPFIARHCYFLATDRLGNLSSYGAYDVHSKLTPQKSAGSDLPGGQPKLPGGCSSGVLGSDCIQVPILRNQSFAALIAGLEAAANSGPEGIYDAAENNSNGWVQRQIDSLHLATTLPSNIITSEADLCRLLGYLEDNLRTNGVRLYNQVILFYYGLLKCAF